MFGLPVCITLGYSVKLVYFSKTEQTQSVDKGENILCARSQLFPSPFLICLVRPSRIQLPSIGAVTCGKSGSWKDPTNGIIRTMSREWSAYSSTLWYVTGWGCQHQLHLPEGSTGQDHEQPSDCMFTWDWGEHFLARCFFYVVRQLVIVGGRVRFWIIFLSFAGFCYVKI